MRNGNNERGVLDTRFLRAVIYRGYTMQDMRGHNDTVGLYTYTCIYSFRIGGNYLYNRIHRMGYR